VVVCDQHILEKPRDLQHAIEILSMLSGRSHSVLSAVAVVDASRCEFSVSLTDVTFKAFSRAEIERYWATGEPADKAGAYGIQGLGAVFVDAISGSYSNVVGLPLEKTVQLLARFDINYWQ
jgi:septum formation protein